MRRRGFKRKLINALLYLTFVMAIVIFVLACVQLAISNGLCSLTLLLSGGYILTFCAVNDVGL